MNILFISYWGLREGLTQSTVIPNVKLLSSLPKVNKVILCTIERSELKERSHIENVDHIPLFSANFKNVLINKLNDFLTFPKLIRKVVEENKVNLIICRSSLAGGIAHGVSRRTGVPYIVESFEPHASYMVESGVWKKWDPRVWIENYFQNVQRKTAAFLLPVATNYSMLLLKSGVPKDRIIVVPCVVDLNRFYRKNDMALRARLGIGKDAVVGVYVGKFGGLYYDEEAFSVFSSAQRIFERFYLLILTPTDQAWVKSKVMEKGFSADNCKVLEVHHADVPDYLSIADFAFATYKPSDSKAFLSPIKVGEYWACGLPVLLTQGVGDDAQIIERTKCGATFSMDGKNVELALSEIRHQLQQEGVRDRNRELAELHRNPKIMTSAYQKIIEHLA